MTENVKNETNAADAAIANVAPMSDPETDAPLDAQSMAAIRELLDGEDTAPAAAPTPRADGVATSSPEAPQTAAIMSNAPTEAMKRDRLPPIEAAPAGTVKAAKAAKAPRGSGTFARLTAPFVARIKGYRPTPKHMIVAALLVLVFFRPWLVLGIVLLSLLVFIGVFLILGYDGFWQRGMAIARWYAQRNPDRAFEMHSRLDQFAMKWDAVLDKFPDGTVDGLYLPDFQEIEAAEKRHEAALDRRLKDMRETEA